MWESIHFLIWAEEAEEARDFAEGHFQDLVEHGAFDYADQSNTRVLPYDSAEGRSLVDEAWLSYRNGFQRTLEELRQALGRFSDEEIVEGKEAGAGTFVGKTRYLAHVVGQYFGPETRLYNHEGVGILTSAELEQAIEDRAKAWPEDRRDSFRKVRGAEDRKRTVTQSWPCKLPRQASRSASY